jgi:hypothetical protein
LFCPSRRRGEKAGTMPLLICAKAVGPPAILAAGKGTARRGRGHSKKLALTQMGSSERKGEPPGPMRLSLPHALRRGGRVVVAKRRLLTSQGR